jgi:8-oxo-dGTP diphosphatase
MDTTSTAQQLVFLEPPPNYNPRFHIAACFCEYEGKFLFLLRQPDKSCGNTWGIPGGKVDKGQTAQEGVLRELFEETGWTIDANDIQDLGTVFIRYPTHDFTYSMFLTTFTQAPPVVVLNPVEHQEGRWITLKEALKLPLIPGEDECIFLTYGKELKQARPVQLI